MNLELKVNKQLRHACKFAWRHARPDLVGFNSFSEEGGIQDVMNQQHFSINRREVSDEMALHESECKTSIASLDAFTSSCDVKRSHHIHMRFLCCVCRE